MNSQRLTWITAALLYALFVGWYTDFGGPLDEQEIDHFLAKMQERGNQEEGLAVIEKFMREDTGRQFFMVNLIDYNEAPPDVAGAAPGASAQELMNRYMEYMMPQLLKRASHPVLVGDARLQSVETLGVEAKYRVWDFAGVIRYRSRRSLMEIVANAEQGDSHTFKLAALTKTIALPIETDMNLGDPRFFMALILLCLALVITRLQSR